MGTEYAIFLVNSHVLAHFMLKKNEFSVSAFGSFRVKTLGFFCNRFYLILPSSNPYPYIRLIIDVYKRQVGSPSATYILLA